MDQCPVRGKSLKCSGGVAVIVVGDADGWSARLSDFIGLPSL